jgi:KDO2-lipid IV(A) lauroyltransferase
MTSSATSPLRNGGSGVRLAPGYRLKARWQRIKHPAGVHLLKALVGFAGHAPRWLVLAAFGWLGRVRYLVSGRDRQRVLDHLELSLPGMSARARRRMARRVFVELYRNGGETVRFLKRPARELLDLVDVEGEEHLEAALAGGRGVVGVTGHIGAWELIAGYVAQRGFAVTVLARPLKEESFEFFLEELRRRLGISTVPESGDLRPALRTLRAGGVLGLLIDQGRRGPGIWVPFLGRPARMASGAAELARRTGALLLPLGIRRVGSRQRLTVLPPVDVDWQHPGATAAVTAALCRSLESLIWRCPEQWTWMYDAWAVAAGGAADGGGDRDASTE